MALFTWSDRFSVKIPSIDAQHQKIINYINELHEGMTAGKGAQVLGPVLGGLAEYTANHFKYEEMLFAAHKWPDADKHKQAHKKLVEQVLDFKKKFEAGEATISMDIMNFLKDWLTSHILKEDMTYSSYLNGKGVK